MQSISCLIRVGIQGMSSAVPRHVCVRKSGYRLSTFREPPFPVHSRQRNHHANGAVRTHHLECVQLLFDLLSQHRCQSIACSNVPSPIILQTSPGIMQLYGRTKTDITSGETARRAWHALGATVGILSQGEEIIFTLNCDRVGPSMPQTRLFVSWCACNG